MARKLPHSVLVALGAVTLPVAEGCIGPCLDMAVETADPCDDTADCDTGQGEVQAQGAAAESQAQSGAQAAARVLQRGVLPPDVAARLEAQRSED